MKNVLEGGQLATGRKSRWCRLAVEDTFSWQLQGGETGGLQLRNFERERNRRERFGERKKQKRWLQKEWGRKGGCRRSRVEKGGYDRDRWEDKSEKQRRFSREEKKRKEREKERKKEEEKRAELNLRGLVGKGDSLAGCLRGRIVVRFLAHLVGESYFEVRLLCILRQLLMVCFSTLFLLILG